MDSALSALEVQEFQDGDLSVEFEKAQTTVLGSFSHPLGVRIKNFKVTFKKGCRLLTGRFDTVVVPFHLMKAFRKKIELGLVRLSGGQFELSSVCQPENLVLKDSPLLPSKTDEGVKVKKTDTSLEQMVTKLFDKVAKLDLSFVKESDKNLKFQGLLLYDFKLGLDVGKSFSLDRLKVMFGLGDLIAAGEWSSQIVLNESVTDLSGEFKVSKESVKLVAEAKEKEGKLTFESTTKRLPESSQAKPLTLINLGLKDTPLSIIKRWREFQIGGLNLRKSWLSFDLTSEITSDKIKLKSNNFKLHGDFGDLTLSPVGLSAEWSTNSMGSTSGWSQPKKATFKLSDVVLDELVSIKPKKKVKGVFGKFGEFNALLELQDFKSITGEFETKDFSILFRSMGKAIYQKAQYARGQMKYDLGERFVLVLDEVKLIDGDFEGSVNFKYDYKKEIASADFDIPVFKLNSQVSKELFGLSFKNDISLSGKGRSLKSIFKKNTDENFEGVLDFTIKTKQVEFKHWGMSGVKASCNLGQSKLNCNLSAEEVMFSKELKERSELEKQIYKEMQSSFFSYEKNKLTFDLVNMRSKIYFDWVKEDGLSLYSKGYGQERVRLRQL